MPPQYTIKLLSCDDCSLINNFVASQKHASFLQSFEWGEFQRVLSHRIIRIGVFEEGAEKNLLGSALVIQHALPFKKYYGYCPRGPVCAREDALPALFEYLFLRAGIFLRVDPLDSAFKAQARVTKNIQPPHTRVLDISGDESGMLSRMHHKTRYNIRLAQKKGVEVRCYAEPSSENILEFINLLALASARHGIKAHRNVYYETMLKMLSAPSSHGLYANLCTAYVRNQPIASNIILFFGDTATYLHGGSRDDYKEMMAPYLLQWESIRRAKEQGHRFYDFWGVAPPGAGEHAWKGITRFKEGFGGEVISYPCAFDVPLQKKRYYLYQTARKLMRVL